MCMQLDAHPAKLTDEISMCQGLGHFMRLLVNSPALTEAQGAGSYKMAGRVELGTFMVSSSSLAFANVLAV